LPQKRCDALVVAGPNGGEAPGIEELRHEIDELDGEIIRLWQRRAAISHTIGDRRVAAGGPRIVLRREHEIIARYRAALGPVGGTLALLVLQAGRGALDQTRGN
jgi:chorismate mutase